VFVPQTLYEPVLLDDNDECIVHQGDAFPTESEAQKVHETWRAEGRTERMAINLVPLYDSAEQWQADR